jgi:hypothetical protein
MQNKPNSLNNQMNVTLSFTKDYESKSLPRTMKNKAKTNPIKPNFIRHSVCLPAFYPPVAGWRGENQSKIHTNF